MAPPELHGPRLMLVSEGDVMAWLHKPLCAPGEPPDPTGPRPDSMVLEVATAAPPAEASPRSQEEFTVTIILERPVRRLALRGDLDLVTSDKVYELLSGVIDRHASYIEI